MADFFQTGAMATLHRLGEPGVDRLEAQLRDFVQDMPIALVLPCHIGEIGTPALRGILRELEEVDYLKQVVVGIDGASPSDWRKARQFFAKSRHKPVLLWNDGPRMKRLIRKLADGDLDPGQRGKGRNMWLCYGYVLASEQAKVIAAHDCDILTYGRELLARLCYPVANDSLGFDFCKGYTARFTHKLNGRVMRLMFTPLIRSLESIIGTHPFLIYMDTFRYPLSGEICVDLDVVRRTRMPSDWGVEVGMLAEVFRVTSPKAICQVELADRFDHKHQELSPRDANRGLNKMAIDIARCIFRTVAAEGIRMDSGLFDTLLSAYLRKAEDTIRFYHADAEINGLAFDRHQEELAVATFVRGIRTAARQFMENPLGEPLIPNWNRVESALPEFLEELRTAVEEDNKAALAKSA
ncbi:MAG: glycosyl transferase [Chthoniobacterales bacterium]|jgi:glucosyl-3-phosphoglycerate synthase